MLNGGVTSDIPARARLMSLQSDGSIKLNATGQLPKDYSKYSLAFNPDVDRWPLLKSTDPKHSFGKFQTLLTGITLEDDPCLLGKFLELHQCHDYDGSSI